MPAPPPSNPFDGGDEPRVRELLSDSFDLEIEEHVSTLRIESAEAYWDLFRPATARRRRSRTRSATGATTCAGTGSSSSRPPTRTTAISCTRASTCWCSARAAERRGSAPRCPADAGSDVREHRSSGRGTRVEIQRLDEQARVADLAAAAAAHEAPELLLGGRPRHAGCFWRVRNAGRSPSRRPPVRRRRRRGRGSVRPRGRRRTRRSRASHLGAREIGAEAGTLEPRRKSRSSPASQRPASPTSSPCGPNRSRKRPIVLRAAHRHDGHALGVESRPRRPASVSSAS